MGGILTYDRTRTEGGRPKLIRKNNSHDFAEQYTKIHFADWNGDGLPDLLMGYSAGFFQILINEGTKKAPLFNKAVKIMPVKGDFGRRPSPYLFDWDKDGLVDLIVGTERGKVFFHRNVATDEKPKYAQGIPLTAGGKTIQCGYRARICIADWNGDGTPDLILGNAYAKMDPKLPRGRETRGKVWIYLGEEAPK